MAFSTGSSSSFEEIESSLNLTKISEQYCSNLFNDAAPAQDVLLLILVNLIIRLDSWFESLIV